MPNGLAFQAKFSHYSKEPRFHYVRHPLDFFREELYGTRNQTISDKRVARIIAPANTDVIVPWCPPLSLPLHISDHALTIWRSCRRKHLWSHGYGLYPTGQSIHLVAGASLAAGLEAARRFAFSDPNPESVSVARMLEAAYPAFSKTWGNYTPPDNPRLAKTFVNTFDALRFYLTEHHPGKDQIQPSRREDNSPAVEYTFAIETNVLHPSGDPFLFIGRFDMLGLIDVYGESIPCIVDEKTTSSISYNWVDQWDMHGQFLGYIWALQQQGVDIRHAVVRGIAILKSEHKVVTAICEYPQHLIDRWGRGMQQDLRAIASAYVAHDIERDEEMNELVFPYNFGNTCRDYGGCAYATLCTAHDPQPFMSNYVVHRYNALSSQPIEEVQNDV